MNNEFKKMSIRAARVEVGLSQTESAKALGISKKTLSNWENFYSYPDVTFLDMFSELYQIPRDQLYFKKIKKKDSNEITA